MKRVREYSSPEQRNSKKEQPLAGCAVTIFALLCIHTMAYLHHTKENLERSQTVTLTEICTQFLISSNTTLITTHLISDSEPEFATRKQNIYITFPPHMDKYHDIFANYFQHFMKLLLQILYCVWKHCLPIRNYTLNYGFHTQSTHASNTCTSTCTYDLPSSSSHVAIKYFTLTPRILYHRPRIGSTVSSHG